MSKDNQNAPPAGKKSDSGDSQNARNKPQRRRRNTKSADHQKDRPRKYQQKLLLEEDEEQKSVLIKVTRFTGTRQIINYALAKVKQEWKIEMNAFSMDIAKVLQATEILKTRNPFLFQETKMLLQSKEVNRRASEEGGENSTYMKSFSGISVVLSRNQFEVSDPVGYQKPKPRQFVQPLPRQKAEEKKSEPPKEESKRAKESKPKRQRERANSHSDEQEREYVPVKTDKNGKKQKNRGSRKQTDVRSNSEEKWDHDGYEEMMRENPKDSREQKGRRPPPPPRYHPYDDFYHRQSWDYHRGPPMDMRYSQRDDPRFDHRPAYREIGTRGRGNIGTPGFRGGMRGGRPMGGPPARGGGGLRGGHYGPPQHRPGFFPAQSDRERYRNDDHQQYSHRGNDHVERERLEHQRRQMRDQRNRPQGIAEKYADHH